MKNAFFTKPPLRIFLKKAALVFCVGSLCVFLLPLTVSHRFALKECYFMGLITPPKRTDFDRPDTDTYYSTYYNFRSPRDGPVWLIQNFWKSKTVFVSVLTESDLNPSSGSRHLCQQILTSISLPPLAEVPLGKRGLPSCPSEASKLPDVLWTALLMSECEFVYFVPHRCCNSVPDITSSLPLKSNLFALYCCVLRKVTCWSTFVSPKILFDTLYFIFCWILSSASMLNRVWALLLVRVLYTVTLTPKHSE